MLDPTAWPVIESAVPLDADQEARIDALLASMSLEEKVGQMVQAEIKHASPADVRRYHLGSVLNGGGSWPNRDSMAAPEDWLTLAEAYHRASTDTSDGRVGIPIMWGTDAVHGHNNVVGATIFPHNIGLGAANNEALMEEIGKATALEVRATGIGWTFAPTLAVARDDRWGRTYESYSEDPAIVARLGAALVRGLQGGSAQERFAHTRVLATAKHFIGDGGTLNGRDRGDTFVDERTLREVHGAGYFTTLSEGVQVVMVSYSSWRGYKMHGNKYYLTTVLKNRMGFDGFILGDWYGHEELPECSRQACSTAILAGIDMMMVPEDWKAFVKNTLKEVRLGEIAIERVDDAVRRILRVKLRARLFDKAFDHPVGTEWIGHPSHRAIARQAARESMVLLKNQEGLLPLAANSTVLVAGQGADDFSMQTGGWTITWQGTGNKREHYRGTTSIVEGIREAVEAVGGRVIEDSDARGQDKADVAIVVFGEPAYVEGAGDREHLVYTKLNDAPLEILRRLDARGIPAVSVFLSGRPMMVKAEMDVSDAFVAAWLPGSEGAAVADMLIADTHGAPRHQFTGRLSFSWPRSETQARINRDDDVYFPQFPVGFGLEYP